MEEKVFCDNYSSCFVREEVRISTNFASNADDVLCFVHIAYAICSRTLNWTLKTWHIIHINSIVIIIIIIIRCNWMMHSLSTREVIITNTTATMDNNDNNNTAYVLRVVRLLLLDDAQCAYHAIYDTKPMCMLFLNNNTWESMKTQIEKVEEDVTAQHCTQDEMKWNDGMRMRIKSVDCFVWVCAPE